MTIDLKETAQGVGSWLDQMADGLEPGRFRFCSKGSLVPVRGKAGLMATCFAMRSAWQSGIWDKWQQDRKEACVRFIQSFQQKDGFFYDPWLNRKAGISLETIVNLLLGRVPINILYQQKKLNMRAETRQCIGDLFNVGEKSLSPAPIEYPDPLSFQKYIRTLSWTQPYSAGSHLSHLMCFLAVNKEYFPPTENCDFMISEILKLLSELYDEETGTWFLGKPENVFKINGAMKILSGLQWLGQKLDNPEKLIDFALAQPFQNDGCGMLNRLFVLQQAGKSAPEGYRYREIQKIASRALASVQEFRNSDGGFSFYKHRSQPSYYGAKVSKGLDVSDLHGTAMMTWAIGVSLDLLGENAPDGAENWHCHRA